MKKTLLNTLTFVSLFLVSTANAQVGIGVPAGDIHPSAELEVKSTEKGFLLPRMTKAQRIAIGSPATGLIVYQTDGDVPNPAGLYYFDGLIWKNGIGAQGVQGLTGPQGLVGPAGANGTNGSQGLPGAKGDTGDQGIQGIQGLTGPQGPIGPAGANGTNGAQGLQGAKGDTGDQGIQGIQGPKGEVGPAGPKGDPGTSTGATQLTISSTVANTNNLLSFTNAVSGSAISSLQTNNQLKFNPGTGTLTAPDFTGRLTGDVTGNASSASKVALNNSFTTSTNYLSFSPSTNGVSDLKTNPSLTFNPGTGNLSAPDFTGRLTGNVNGNATSATQVAVTNSFSTGTNYLSFSPSTNGVSDLKTNPSLTFNPGTGVLTAPDFTGRLTGDVTGNATSASKVAVTSTTVPADRYLCFTPNTSSGNADLQINSLSQGLKYNPGTGVLTVPSIKTPTGTSSQYLMADGSVSSAAPQGQTVLFTPTTPPTNGMVVYKYFQNNTTATLYDDGQIRLRLNLGSNKLYLTNVNKNIPNILSNIGTLSSSGAASMSMAVGNGYFQNFGTAAVAMGTEMNVYSNLSTSNNYVMTMYISAPDNPSYGLYVINIYFNGPTSSLNYSNMTVNYYKDPTAAP